jgi:hypothetical protein
MDYGVWREPRPYMSSLLGCWSWIARSLVVWGCWSCFPSLFSSMLYWLNPVGSTWEGVSYFPPFCIFLFFFLMKWHGALLRSSRKKKDYTLWLHTANCHLVVTWEYHLFHQWCIYIRKMLLQLMFFFRNIFWSKYHRMEHEQMKSQVSH